MSCIFGARTNATLFGGVYVAHFKNVVVCCPFMCLSVLSFLITTMFGSSLPQLFTGGSYLRDFFAHSGVQHIVCCVFLHFVYPVLPVSLDFSFLIALSVLSNVY